MISTKKNSIAKEVLAKDEQSAQTSASILQGASSSNTAPSKYIYPLRCVIDSLYLSFSGSLKENIEIQLNELKDSAQGKGYKLRSEAFITIFEHQFEVLAKGSGKFAFVLVDNWYRIELSSRRADKLPLAYVQISSELLTFEPIDEIVADITKIVEYLGFVTQEPSISRVDLCLDFFTDKKFNPETIVDEQWRGRAVDISLYSKHRQRSGFSIGKGDIVARLYNKLLEIESSEKDYLKLIWIDKGWNNVEPVWRIEFQFRREVLQSFNIRTVDELLQSKQTLWHYASQDWLNLVIPNLKDKNSSRWPIHPAWKEIIYSCSTDKDSIKRTVPKERLPSDDIIFVTGAGYFISFMAREGISEFIEGMAKFYFQADQYYQLNRQQTFDSYLQSRIKEKSKRFNIQLKEKE